MTIIKHRDIRGLVGTLCGACIVTLVALGFGAAPAWAQSVPDTTIAFLPPQVKFISNGKFTGTLQIQGTTLPITGTIAYLTGDIEYLKISVDTDAGQQITSNSWVFSTVIPTVTEWETVSTFPTTCQKEVFSETLPQCTTWGRTPKGDYTLACTVTAQGNKATLEYLVTLTTEDKLKQLQETATITGENGNSQGNETNSLAITMTEQGTTPPIPTDFTDTTSKPPNFPPICTVTAQSRPQQ